MIKFAAKVGAVVPGFSRREPSAGHPEPMIDLPPDEPSRTASLDAASLASEEHLEKARQDWRQNWEERRSHQRHPLENPFSCHLELDSGLFPPMPVQLLDLSLGGACLLITSLVELRRGEMGELHSHGAGNSGQGGLDRLRLRVCWQEVRDWITAVGVAFDPPLQALPQELELGRGSGPMSRNGRAVG